MTVKVVDPKVSYSKRGPRLRVIILGKIERWKEGLLLAWLAAWIFCGVVVAMELASTSDPDRQVVFIGFLAFWAYFLWRVGRTVLFRLGGNELIEVNDEALVLKKSFFTYGKTREYFLENIQNFKPIEISKTSFAYTYENGWWVLGGEKLGFEYHGRFVKFAMQIEEGTVSRLYSLINRQIRENLKKKA
jgi:hypothetical protein